jgi:hypothetical protein
MAAIIFTDSIGSATLESDIPAPGNRTAGWTPLAQPIGPISYGLGTGIPEQWSHRTDYGASFTLPFLPDDCQAVATRLIAHLKAAGSVTVETGDQSNNSYSGCYLWPGSDPKLSERAQPSLRRTFTVSVLQPGATSPLVCLY